MHETTKAYILIMSFREMMEYLDEVKAKRKGETHPGGTYVCARLDKQSQNALADWVRRAGIPNPLDRKQYHVTIIYSRIGVPEVRKEDLTLP